MEKVERISRETEKIEKYTIYLEDRVVEIETNAKVMVDVVPNNKNIN